MSTQNPPAAKHFKVGDHVKFPWGDDQLEGMVVEDRGRLGVGGEQVVRVRAEFDEDFVRDAELRASPLVKLPTEFVIFETPTYRICLDYRSPAADYPQPGMRIVRSNGQSAKLPDLRPTDLVAANVISDLFGEDQNMLACEIAIRAYKQRREKWDEHIRYAAESFIGKDNVRSLNRVS